MNIELLAADIASRVPAMAKDSSVNNVETIKGVIAAEIERCAKNRRSISQPFQNEPILPVSQVIALIITVTAGIALALYASTLP